MKTLDFGSFPISSSEFSADLQVLVKQLHERYSSRVTVVVILPQGIWAAKKIEEIANDEGLHIHLCGLGIIPIEKDGKKSYTIVEPPSHHSIFGKKVVILGGYEPWDFVLATGVFIRNMRPQSIEIGTLIAHGELPEWVNPDYVVYQAPINLVVNGLGFGYTSEEASGCALISTLVETTSDASGKNVGADNVVQPEEVEHD